MADWEVVIIRIMFFDGIPYILAVSGSRHGEVYNWPITDIEFSGITGNNPILYPAKGGHGIYRFAGVSSNDSKKFNDFAKSAAKEKHDGLGKIVYTYTYKLI